MKDNRLKRLMGLAKLHVATEEEGSYSHHLDAILGYVEAFNDTCNLGEDLYEGNIDTLLDANMFEGKEENIGDFILRGTRNFSDGYIKISKIIKETKNVKSL